MPLAKPVSDLKIAILVPTYKRSEYLEKCLRSLEEAQEYNGRTIFYVCFDGGDYNVNCRSGSIKINYLYHPENLGLRFTILEFFEWAMKNEIDFIGKIDSDCTVPKNFLNDILSVFEKTDVDILSPNVYPSNAAEMYGVHEEGLPYMPAKMVGGLWFMRTELLKDIDFVNYAVSGLQGAISVLRQIILIKNPKLGWLKDVVVQDIGHWSGNHPDCIKNEEHYQYYQEVGRRVAW